MDLTESQLLLISLSNFLEVQSEQLRIQDQKINVLTEAVHELQSEVQEIKIGQNQESQTEEIRQLKQLAIFDSESGEVYSIEDFQNQNP